MLHCNIRWNVLYLIAAITIASRNVDAEEKYETSITSRIINGVDAPIDRYPYSVALRQTKGRRYQVCAGTLIAPDIIMTAAHCDQGVFNLLEAVVNPYYTNPREDAETKRLLAQRKHPEYGVGANWANDVMLLKLASPSQYPWIRLNTNPLQPIPGLSMTVIGWGTREVGQRDTPNVLQEQGSIKSITNQNCNKMYEEANLPVLENMLCVTNDTSCQGDSGGPLIIKNEISGDVQVGIVSWAIGCGDGVYPGVHSRVSHLFDWIERNVCEMSNLIPQYMSCAPTLNPTISPTQTPSNKPSPSPSTSPSTTSPSETPSKIPTQMPTSSPAPTRQTVDILLRIKTDNWANEIGWELIWGRETVEKRVFGDYQSKGIIEEKLTLDYGLTYSLFMKDLGKDGICCEWGSGSVTVYLGFEDDDDNALAFRKGDYGESTSIEFLASEAGKIRVTRGPAYAPTASPVPSSSPTDFGACAVVPEGGCSVCGEGKCVTNPTGLFQYENQPEAPCDVLQAAGYQGYIDNTYCSFFNQLPEINVCGCAAPTSAPSASPTISTPPTPSPTISFTPSVSPSTSMAPTERIKINVLAVIYTDDFPTETSWSIQNSETGGDTIFEIPFRTYENTTSFKLTQTVELIQGNDYRFSIFDQFGDGTCCEYGQDGNASVYYGTEEILSNRLLHIPGNYSSADFRLFTAEAPEGYATFPPVTPSPITGLCFPGTAKCNVHGKGEIQINDLKLGDSVLVRGGAYEKIYSFGHYEAELQAEYLRLTTTTSYLELTKDHMVFIEEGRCVPASSIKIGDKVEMSSGSYDVVNAIERVVRKGAFAPFTPSGTIIVNGVGASSFIALQESETLLVGEFDTGLKFQYLAHSFETPHRLWCSYISSCMKEQYTISGVSNWVATPLFIVQWILVQHPFLMMMLSFPLILILFALSNLVTFISIFAVLSFSYFSNMSLRIKVR